MRYASYANQFKNVTKNLTYAYPSSVIYLQLNEMGPDRPWGPPSLLYNGYRVFPGGKERPGRDADLSPPSSAVGMKE